MDALIWPLRAKGPEAIHYWHPRGLKRAQIEQLTDPDTPAETPNREPVAGVRFSRGFCPIQPGKGEKRGIGRG